MQVYRKLLFWSLVSLISAPALTLAANDVERKAEKHVETLIHPGGRAAHWFGSQHEMKKEPVTYLGVLVAPIEPVVSAQLGLQKGIGLTVNHVAEDSPAEKAGLEKFDILKLLNDQILINPRQFQVLVRSKEEGDKIMLTILRKGSELKLEVTLGKHKIKPDFRSHFERYIPMTMPIPPHMPSDFQHGTGRHSAEKMEEDSNR